ncbi:MAG: hypothetical protein EZS28_031347 [Streblomastix strix]|uniref:Uncharacterized protein n=1 Tax=Streblomastix strix TaxID=222440 RepID=A0A5J4UTS3_9EUKA|nr:MAG: hypothetical protein EZS28_031347 [Streblomastix strix]
MKSALHNLIVYPQHRPYVAFEAFGKVHQFKAMPLGTQYLQNFFIQVLAVILKKIRKDGPQPKKIAKHIKTTDQLPQKDSGLEEDAFKDDRSKKTGITLLTKEIHLHNRKTSPNQDQVPSINNRLAEFSKSPSKRSFPLIQVNGLSKNEGSEEQ